MKKHTNKEMIGETQVLRDIHLRTFPKGPCSNIVHIWALAPKVVLGAPSGAKYIYYMDPNFL